MNLCLALTGAAAVAAAQGSSSAQEASSALARGDSAKAGEISRRLLDRTPDNSAARVLYARALAATGDTQAAFEQIEKGLSLAPADPNLLYYAIHFSAALGQDQLEELHAKAPDSSRSHQLLAEIADAQSDTSQAMREYQAALDRDPKNLEALVALADLERKASLCEKAVPHYQAAIAIDPSDVDSLYSMGACQNALGDPSSAAEALSKVVAAQPGYAAAQYQLGEALSKRGQPALALPHLQAAVRLEPNFKQAYFLLGRVYKALAKPEQGAAAMAKFQQLQAADVKAREAYDRERIQSKEPGGEAPRP